MIDEDDASNSYHKHVQATTTLGSEEIVDNKEEGEKEKQVEHPKQIEAPANPNLSNDKEVSTEAPSFIIVPLETHNKPKASAPQCLKEPSYAKILEDLCMQTHKSRNHLPKKSRQSKQAHKSRNHLPKKSHQSKQVGYLRWQNILPRHYNVLNKKRWKGLVGHSNDRGKHNKFHFPFYFLHL
jgi:hypothetical protein